MKKFYVTTPIYYVNSHPHLGHAYTDILTDVRKRAEQLTGFDSFLLTGTDEHGDKIAKAAQEQGISPQDLTDKNSQQFRDLIPIIRMNNDDFIRTTDSRHKKLVQNLLQKVFDKGDIYFAEYTGKYCVGCERFLGDDELEEGKCPDHQKEPDVISEKNYFFKMSKYWQALKNHIESHPSFIVTENFKNEVLGLLKQEPTDLCISRPKERLTWGIELPFDDKYVTYVWFDALINYLSGINYPDGENSKEYWAESHHVIAKDILKPHCVYWPTMLMSMDIPLPKQVAIHGYWLMDQAKMSKSLGNQVDPISYCEQFGVDAFRYYLMKNMTFGRDAHFSHEDFINTCNADLSNNFGNLYSRVAGLCRKNCDQKIPIAQIELPESKEIREEGPKLKEVLFPLIQNWQMNKYLETLVHYANKVNKFLDETKPWALAKDPDQKERLNAILKEALEAIRICYIWLWPVTPVTCEKVFAELIPNVEIDPETLLANSGKWNQLSPGQDLPKKTSGFPRLMSEQED